MSNLEKLQESQQAAEAATGAAAAQRPSGVFAPLGLSAEMGWVWLAATVVVGALAVRLVFGRMLGLGGVRNRRRAHTVLIGLPDSGKTALFAQLVRRVQLRETRTSMRENVGTLLAAKERGMADSAAGVTVVDCPGHPRLRESMLRAVGEASTVVVVIDAVTVQDSQHDGVAALAELLLGVMQAPEFYGVQRLAFACTKRDEVTSYAAKAVRRLLEAAMVASIASRQNAMGRVESVRDSSNTVIAAKGRKSAGGGGGRRYVLSIDGEEGVGQEALLRNGAAAAGVGGSASSRKFSFDQLGIPLTFVDVSSRPQPSEHKYSVEPLEAFLVGQ